MREPDARMVSFPVRDQPDLLVGLQRVREQGLLAGADDMERGMVVTMISELATNIMKYGRGGTMRVGRTMHGDQVDIDIWADDNGPGIADLESALRDHFTTGNTLGLGLPGVRRMADHFDIQSPSGAGTHVHARRRVIGRRTGPGAGHASAPTAPQPVQAQRVTARWDIGLGVRAMPGEIACGDLAMALELGDGLLLALVDGTGHGVGGGTSARRMERHLLTSATSDLPGLLRGAHHALQGSPGAAVGLLFISPDRAHARYAGVGNTGIARRAGAPWRPLSRDGILGQRLPTMIDQGAPLERGDLIVLWTDGLGGMPDAISARDAFRPAQELADMLLRRQGKPHDDAGCIVLRWNP